MFGENDFAESRASVGGGLVNGDYIFKITSWSHMYRGKDGTSSSPFVNVSFQGYQDIDGHPVSNSSYNKGFFVYPRAGETEGQAVSRRIALGALKQLMFSVKGREMDQVEFETLLQDPTEWINELVGARVAWVRRYNDPSKTELAYDRYFKPLATDGVFTMYDGNPIGVYSEARLGKRIRDNLMGSGPAPSGGSNIAAAAAQANRDLDMDSVPF
jgi:hypothetical protein